MNAQLVNGERRFPVVNLTSVVTEHGTRCEVNVNCPVEKFGRGIVVSVIIYDESYCLSGTDNLCGAISWKNNS